MRRGDLGLISINMHNVIDSLWFNGPTGTIGLVVCDNDHELKAYVGFIAIPIHEMVDAQYVARDGAPFPIEGALAISSAARDRHERYLIKGGSNPGELFTTAELYRRDNHLISLKVPVLDPAPKVILWDGECFVVDDTGRYQATEAWVAYPSAR